MAFLQATVNKRHILNEFWVALILQASVTPTVSRFQTSLSLVVDKIMAPFTAENMDFMLRIKQC